MGSYTERRLTLRVARIDRESTAARGGCSQLRATCCLLARRRGTAPAGSIATRSAVTIRRLLSGLVPVHAAVAAICLCCAASALAAWTNDVLIAITVTLVEALAWRPALLEPQRRRAPRASRENAI
jgi:hypothetical protein